VWQLGEIKMHQDSKTKLEKAIKFLKKAQDYSSKPGFLNDGLEYDAALFNLKAGLELLGQAREDKGINSYNFFEQAAYLRNVIVHNGFEMHEQISKSHTQDFFNNHLGVLIQEANLIIQYGSGTGNTSFKNLEGFRGKLISGFVLKDTSSLEDYKKKFEFYAKRFLDISFLEGNDPAAPVKKAAGLDMMVILQEISTKKPVTGKPTLLTSNSEYLTSLIFAQNMRNEVAHADLDGKSIKSLKEIQEKMKPQQKIVQPLGNISSSPSISDTSSAETSLNERLTLLDKEAKELKKQSVGVQKLDMQNEAEKAKIIEDAKERAKKLVEIAKQQEHIDKKLKAK
jgi:hypothetical protein